MSQFSIGASASQSPTSTPAQRTSYSYSDSDDEDNLPYPGDLPRSDFLSPDFDPQTYLSSLRNRHQTLEDLRSDLRQRSQLLNKELLDLVNGNYEEFLRLGADLKGGEEKVEGVRVGVLGFQREVEGVQKVVREREREVGTLLAEKKRLRKDVVIGRALLDVDMRLVELEESLGLQQRDGFDDDSELDDDGDVSKVSTRRLQRHVEQYILITRLVERIGREHPFLQAQSSRINDCRTAVLLDLAAALGRAKAAKEQDAMLSLVKLYRLLGAEGEGVKALRGG